MTLKLQLTTTMFITMLSFSLYPPVIPNL